MLHEESLKLFFDCLRFRKDEQTAHELVEAVDNEEFPVRILFFHIFTQVGVGRVFFFMRCRYRQQTGGLVDDEKLVIFKENLDPADELPDLAATAQLEHISSLKRVAGSLLSLIVHAYASLLEHLTKGPVGRAGDQAPKRFQQ